MNTDTVRDILDRYEARRSAREPWESHWQELAELMHPRRADFTLSSAPGAKRTQAQFDSVPMLAARGLASAIEGLLTPKTERWFGIKTHDRALNEQFEVKAWLEAAEDRLWQALYTPSARFIKSFGEAYLDLVTLGTAIVFIGERSDLSGLIFRAVHLKNAYIGLSADGEVDTMYLVEELTAPQAAQRFGGKENLGRTTREALERGDRETKFPILQAVMPRAQHSPNRRDSRGLPFAAITVDIDSEHLIGEGGYHEFPYSVMRWDTATGEDYGRSPGMLALPDSKTLMQMGKTLLEAGHKAVDPPWFAPSDSISSAPRTFPGGITYYDAEALQGSGVNRPIFPAVSGANFPLGREMQRDLREQVWSAFFKNVLNLPVQGPAMTATEIIERKQEFVRTVGPTLGRLEPDGPATVVERCFGIMLRNRQLPPSPVPLLRNDIRFEYASPIERVRKQIEASTAIRSTELLNPFLANDPGLLDHFDTDVIVREVPEALGMPRNWVRSLKEVEKKRAEREQTNQAQALAATAGQVLQGGQAGSPVLPDAITSLLGAVTGGGALPAGEMPQGPSPASAIPPDTTTGLLTSLTDGPGGATDEQAGDAGAAPGGAQ